jgi:protein-S-isoprenylcysteine O-methyltransferase Ste14
MEEDLGSDERGLAAEVKAGVVRRVVQVTLVTAFQAALLFIASGRLEWGWAWVYVGLYLAGMAVNGVLLMRFSPETIARRAESEGMKGWDKIVGGLFGAMYFVGIPVVAGLDVRLGWSEGMALWLHIAGAVAFGLGFGLLIWSMVSNAYFSTVVRVQGDLGHAVCDTGPYRYVRHPGYGGAFVHSLVVPLILGSPWALIPGGVGALALILRTALEDGTLREELAGYEAYAGQTRYRLVPGIW